MFFLGHTSRIQNRIINQYSFDLLFNVERTIGDLALVKYYKITYFEFFQCDECRILNINRIGSIQMVHRYHNTDFSDFRLRLQLLRFPIRCWYIASGSFNRKELSMAFSDFRLRYGGVYHIEILLI